MFEHSEQVIRLSVEWLRLFVEGLGAAAILVGLVSTTQVLWRSVLSHRRVDLGNARVTFARYLTLALELQLAADILSTSVSPNWDQIGKLSAIAVIRTALNHFLRQEMREQEVSSSKAGL